MVAHDRDHDREHEEHVAIGEIETIIYRLLSQQVLDLKNHIDFQFRRIMSAITDAQDAIAAETDAVTGIVALLDAVSADLDAALANAGSGGVDPAAIQAITDQINANKQTLADAVVRDTRADPNGGAGDNPPPLDTPADTPPADTTTLDPNDPNAV